MQNHEHDFGDVTTVRNEDGVLVTEKECTEIIETQSHFPDSVIPSQSRTRDQCGAVQVTHYEPRTVVDVHDHHPEYGSSIPVSDSNPEWVENALEKAAKQIDTRTPGMFMRPLVGPEISMLIATPETEYRVIFEEVNRTEVEEHA